MAQLFRRVCKTCKQENCRLQGQTFSFSEMCCYACGTPLSKITVPNRLNLLLTVLFACGGLGGVSEAIKYFRPQPTQVELLPTKIATAGLGDLSIGRAHRQLRAKLREIYHDCKAGPEEKAETEKMLASHPVLAQAYPDIERTRLALMLESCRSVRTGQTLVAQKLYGHARTEFLKATEADPENANAWAALGAVNMLMQREEEARQAYEKALAADPESWVAHYNYGFYFVRKGETDAAFLHLDRAVALLGRSGDIDRGAVIDDLRRNPLLERLRQDPRFTRLLG